MKKAIWKLSTLLLMFSFMVSPAVAQVVSLEADRSSTDEPEVFSYLFPLFFGGTAEYAFVQVAHLAPFAEDASVTIMLNGSPMLTEFGYGDSTGYLLLPPGEHDIALIPTGSDSSHPAIEAENVLLETGTYYTVVAVGDGEKQKLAFQVLVDELPPTAPGKFHLRLGHLAPFATGDDVLADVRVRGVDKPLAANVNFGAVTDFIPLDAGTYDLIITTPGGEKVLIDPGPVTFETGQIISGFATGDTTNQGLSVFILQAGAEGFFLPMTAYVQVAHLASFAKDAGVTIMLNNEPALTNFGYGDSTEYLEITWGEYDIAVIPTDGTDPVITASIVLEIDTYYTIIAVGDGDNQKLALHVLVDDLTPPEPGKFHLRLGHLAPFAKGEGVLVDFRLRGVEEPLFEKVNFGDVTGYIPLDIGMCNLLFTTPGGDTVLIDPEPVPFVEGQIISVFATGDDENQDLGVFALPAGAEGFFLPLKPARLQVAHLAPFADPGIVDIMLNGKSLIDLQDMEYGDSTPYIDLDPGSYLIEIFPNDSDTAAITTSVDLESGVDYTAIAIGGDNEQDLALKVLVDDLPEPEEGKFHLRLGHLAPFASGAATADIREKDGTPVLENVDFGDVSDYLKLDAGEYDLVITTPGGGTVLIDPEPVTFAEGDIVSAFATGDDDNQDLGVFALPAGEVGAFLPLVK